MKQDTIGSDVHWIIRVHATCNHDTSRVVTTQVELLSKRVRTWLNV